MNKIELKLELKRNCKKKSCLTWGGLDLNIRCVMLHITDIYLLKQQDRLSYKD